MTNSPGNDPACVHPVHWRLVSDNRPWHLFVWPGPVSADAPRFLLIHGLGATPAYFQPLAERLSRDGVVYAPDLPDFGGTARLPGPQSTDAIADALANLCGDISEGPFVIVGHSRGCQIAACLAARHPALAGRLVLLSPAADPGTGPLLCQALALAIDVPQEPRRLLRVMIPPMVGAGPRHLLAAVREMKRYRWRDDLPRIMAPTLVMRGERDPLVSGPWCDTVARLVPNARCVEVPGAPHGLNFTDPAPVAAAIRGFSKDL